MSMGNGEFGGDKVDTFEHGQHERRVTPLPSQDDFANGYDMLDSDESPGMLHMMPHERRLELVRGLGARPLDEVMAAVHRHPSAQAFRDRPQMT